MGVGVVFIIALFVWFSKDLPTPSKVVRRDGYSSKVYDRNGNALYDIYDEAKRDPVAFDNVPDYLKKATVAVEDKEFYRIYNTDRFIDTLRCELNVVGLDKMRQFYDLPKIIKPSLGNILLQKNNQVLKQFSRFVDIKSSQQLLFSVDNLKSMEYKDKREMHQRFFIEYHYNLFKGNVDKIFELYKETYSDGRVPSREQKVVKKIVKEIETKRISRKTKLIYTDKFNEIHKKLQTL